MSEQEQSREMSEQLRIRIRRETITAILRIPGYNDKTRDELTEMPFDELIEYAIQIPYAYF